MAEQRDATPSLRDLPTDMLKEQLRNLAGAYAQKALRSATKRVEGATDRLTDYAQNEGGPGLMAAVTGMKNKAEGKSPVSGALKGAAKGVGSKIKDALPGGGKGGKGSNIKVINMVEDIDVGVPLRVAYNQWTQFQDWPNFMKKVHGVEQESDEKMSFKAQVFWSHRSWDATVIEQVPDDRIVWTSSGAKGHVDGTVTFHEMGPRLTKILVVLEYYPQGLFERTGNLWRAQGRRARLELKHFRRHVMRQTILEPDEVEGWRGEIRDREVVVTHEEALEREEQERTDDEETTDDEPRDEDGADVEDEADDEDAEFEDETEDDDLEDEELPEDDEPLDEEEAEDDEDDLQDAEDEYDEYEDDEEDGEEPPADSDNGRSRRRRRTTSSRG